MSPASTPPPRLPLPPPPPPTNPRRLQPHRSPCSRQSAVNHKGTDSPPPVPSSSYRPIIGLSGLTRIFLTGHNNHQPGYQNRCRSGRCDLMSVSHTLRAASAGPVMGDNDSFTDHLVSPQPSRHCSLSGEGLNPHQPRHRWGTGTVRPRLSEQLVIECVRIVKCGSLNHCK